MEACNYSSIHSAKSHKYIVKRTRIPHHLSRTGTSVFYTKHYYISIYKIRALVLSSRNLALHLLYDSCHRPILRESNYLGYSIYTANTFCITCAEPRPLGTIYCPDCGRKVRTHGTNSRKRRLSKVKVTE